MQMRPGQTTHDSAWITAARIYEIISAPKCGLQFTETHGANMVFLEKQFALGICKTLCY